MEAIGSAATIVQLVSFTADALVAGYSYLSKVKRAPHQITSLLREIAELNSLLCQFESLLLDTSRPHVLVALEKMQSLGIFDDCKKLVNVVLRLVQMCERDNGQLAMNSIKRLIWPFKEKEVKQTMQQLARVRDTLSAAIAVDSVATLSRLEEAVKSIDRISISTLNAVREQLPISSMIAGSLDNVEKQLASEAEVNQRAIIRNWLYPEAINVESNLKAALGVLRCATGQWFLNCREFQAWLNNNNTPLWLYGIAGCGKTTLSAIVIQHLQQDSDSMLLYFFCDHRDPSKQSFQDLLHAIVKQLLNASSDCFGDALARYAEGTRSANDGKMKAKPLSTADYVELIKKMCSHWIRVNLVVDALDECINASEFVNGLSELSKSNVRLLLTSRYDLLSREAISQIVCSAVSLVDYMTTDIDEYLRGEVAIRLNNGSLKLRDSDLAEQIVVILRMKADGLILIAKLLLEHICGLRTDRAIKDALENLPSGINATYDEILYKIYNTHKKDISLLQHIFWWLIGCKVPLTLAQLAEAISLRTQDKSLDRDNIPNDIRALVACCGSLVTVTTQVTPDAMFPDLRGRHIDIVTLAHASVGEYLTSGEIGQALSQQQDSRRSQADTQQLGRLFNMELKWVHEELSLLCLQYIGLNDFNQPIRTKNSQAVIHENRQLLTERILQYPLYIYVCRYWPDHFRESSLCESLSRRGRYLLRWFLTLLPKSGQYVSWQQMYHHDCVFYCRGRPPLHYAIEFQLDSIVSLLLPDSGNINDFTFGYTALHVAAQHGALRTTIELISRGAEIDIKSEKYQRQKTALHYAAEAGHKEVVKILLGCGASVHAKSISESTPGYGAARSGCIEVLNLLLDAGADINAQTTSGWTPLFEAVARSHRQMAIHLLGLGADPCVCTNRGDSVLNLVAVSQKLAPQLDLKPVKVNTKDVLREIEDIQRHGVQAVKIQRYHRLFQYLDYIQYSRCIDADLDTRAGTERDKCPRLDKSGAFIAT